MGGRKRTLERRYAESVSTSLTDTRCSILCIALLLSSVEFCPQTARHNLSHDPAGMHLVHCRILPPECSVDSVSLSLSHDPVHILICFLAVLRPAQGTFSLTILRTCLFLGCRRASTQIVVLRHAYFSEFNFFWPCLISQGRKIKNSDFMLPVATRQNMIRVAIIREATMRIHV